MAHWLMKSEPGTYSWSDLVRERSTEWDGVRAPAARLHLKAMERGDEAFFYHSGDERSVIGIMRVTREAAPDPKDPAFRFPARRTAISALRARRVRRPHLRG